MFRVSEVFRFHGLVDPVEKLCDDSVERSDILKYACVNGCPYGLVGYE